MISHFSQEPFEGTLHIKDADLQKMAKVLNDVNIKECPYFDLSDKYGNSARYYRENQWIPCSDRVPEDEYVLISKKPTKISGSKWSVAIAIRTADPRSRKIQWRDSGFGIIQDDKVLAWQPLPEPYKEEEEE